jgi:hypothetical protein
MFAQKRTLEAELTARRLIDLDSVLLCCIAAYGIPYVSLK